MTYPVKELAQNTNASELSNLLESDKFKIISVKSFGAIGDGSTDDYQKIKDAIDYAIANNCKIEFPKADYYISQQLTAVGQYVKIIGNGSRLIRNHADMATYEHILEVSQTETGEMDITVDISEGDYLISVADTTGLESGQVIFIFTDEVYSQVGATSNYYYKGWNTRISEVVSSTQFKVSERSPYSFTVSGNNLYFKYANPMRVDIDDLEFVWEGTVGSKLSQGLVLSYCSNARVIARFNGASYTGITLSRVYNSNIEIQDGIGSNTDIQYNYGILADGVFESTINVKCETARHPITLTGIPCSGIQIQGTLSTQGDSSGVSFDAHCAGNVLIKDAKIPSGANISGGHFKFENCEISNRLGDTSVISHRDSTFMGSLTLSKCKLKLYSANYIYSLNASTYLLDYGNFTMENCELTETNTDGTLIYLLNFLATNVKPVSVGNFVISNNRFNTPATKKVTAMVQSTTNGSSLKATTQGTLTMKDNLFTLGQISTGDTDADTFFSTYNIKNNKHYNDAGIYINLQNAALAVVDDNVIDYAKFNNATKAILKGNRIKQSTDVATLIDLTGTSITYLTNNVFEEKAASGSKAFDIDTVTNAFVGNNFDITGALTLYSGTATSFNELFKLHSAAWDNSHLVMGAYHIWVDSTGDLRIKSSAPTGDTDGTIVGTQS